MEEVENDAVLSALQVSQSQSSGFFESTFFSIFLMFCIVIIVDILLIVIIFIIIIIDIITYLNFSFKYIAFQTN